MGWTGTHRDKHITDTEFFQQQFWPNHTNIILPGAKTVRSITGVGSAYYAAVETQESNPHGDRAAGEVWALVVMVDRIADGDINFTYKELSEESGPGEANAPASVLDKLTPTDDERALEWRRLCRANLTAKRARRDALTGVRTGDVAILDQEYRFQSGEARSRFVLIWRLDRAGRKQWMLTDEQQQTRFRVPRWRDRLVAVERDGERIVTIA